MNDQTKDRPEKLTTRQKLAKLSGSRFVKVIPAPQYEAWRNSAASLHHYDRQGRRVK